MYNIIVLIPIQTGMYQMLSFIVLWINFSFGTSLKSIQFLRKISYNII